LPVLRGSSVFPGGRIRGAIMVAALFSLVAGSAGAATCVATFTLADRWDDVTAIPGYAGGARKVPDWRGNAVLDHEAFTDANGNGTYDPGEPFVDANANGRFDAEFYSPTLTGYVPDPFPGNLLAPNGDLGLVLTLVPAGAGDEAAGHYLSLPPDCSGATPLGSGATRASGADLKAIDRFLRDAMAADPGAAWDAGTGTVVGSAFPPGASPRVLLVAFYDPRAPLSGAHGGVAVDKLMALFVEAVVGKASATARVTKVAPPAAAASTPAASAPTHATWGAVKASYR